VRIFENMRLHYGGGMGAVKERAPMSALHIPISAASFARRSASTAGGTLPPA
jgi:hypothetical protein